MSNLTDDVRENLSELVRRRIKELNTSKAAIARAVGVSRSYIGNIANGTAPTQSGQYNLSPETVGKLAKVLEVSESEILSAMDYLSENVRQYPQTPEELTEALKKYGICNWKITESQLAQIDANWYKNVIDMFEDMVKGKLQKLEEGELKKVG